MFIRPHQIYTFLIAKHSKLHRREMIESAKIVSYLLSQPTCIIFLRFVFTVLSSKMAKLTLIKLP